jgi:hypothetical protein
VCIKHGAKVKQCSNEGCTNHAKKGGVCVKHGATQKRKECSIEGCTNQANGRGMCNRHKRNVLCDASTALFDTATAFSETTASFSGQNTGVVAPRDRDRDRVPASVIFRREECC